ncbi:MAG: hypothetical protein SFW35_02850 [Chitinophagales bacterium]|nr:hypothetical protein [Chitinophagales bacterium]
MIKNLRRYENFHILLWLVKDTCWLKDWQLAGTIMIVPTLLAALHITWLARKEATDLYHNLAVCCWIIANTIWMLGEFYCDDCTRPYAQVFFFMGLAPVLYYYGYCLPKEWKNSNK